MKRIFRARDFQPDPEQDVDEELRSHLELKAEDLMARGMSEEEAWVEARRALGVVHGEAAPRASRTGAGDGPSPAAGGWHRNRDRAASHTRTRLRRRTILDRFDTLFQDVRYALRRMARSPDFTAIALLSLAIGIGANTAVFSVVNAFLIRKAPFRAPEELVRIFSHQPNFSPYMSNSYPDFQDMRAMEGVFSDVGASELLMTVADIGGEPRRAMVEALSANLLPMLGVEPVLGRSFLPEEDLTPGANPVAILGHGFWQRVFDADPEVLGRTVTVAGLPYTVVGVAPDWFGCTVFDGLNMDLFIPLTMSATAQSFSDAIYQRRDNNQFDLMARLAPGMTLEGARASLDLLAAQLQKAYPETNQDRTFRALSEKSVAIDPELDGGMRLTAAFLLVVVGLVLLLACTNLASFLLARGVERQKEVAMRLALGAGRGRLVQQLLTETLLLSLMGGLIGLAVARATLAFTMAYQPPLPISLSLDLGLDRTVFAFTLILSVAAGLVFGLAPALQSTKPDVAPTLKDGGERGSRKRLSLQTALVAFQMTVSMILLVGGGLFMRSLLAAQRMDPGFSTDDAGIAWIDLPGSGVTREEREALRMDLEERLLGQPGIQKVASASRLPLSLGTSSQTFRIPGVDPPTGQEGHRIQQAQVGPGYFDVLGIPILAGRPFTPEDRDGAPEVVVVSQEMARRFWPGEDPIGKQIYRVPSSRPMTVVGVARDTKTSTLGEPPTPFVYFPSAQFPLMDLQILVRGPLPAGELVATLRRVIQEADPTLLVMEIKTMKEHLSVRLFGYRSAALLLGVFGVLALFLSSIGLYGVVSFSVSRRVREMGIRISLGAHPGQVIGLVIRRAMGIVVVGGAIGLAAATVLARLIRVFLLGVSPADPITLAGIPLLLGGVALVAALVPALRASRVNPVEALKTE